MFVYVHVCVICKPIFPQGEAHGLCPFVLWFLLSLLGVPELCLPAHSTMPPSILQSSANWSGCCPTLPGCPAPRSRILKNLGGQGGLIVAVSSFLDVPGNNSAPWGDLAQSAVQWENWATEQQGSPTQGALVTEGMDTLCARLSFQAEALEIFSGLSVSPLGHWATGLSNPIISLFTNSTKGNVSILGASYKIKGISTRENFGCRTNRI